MEKALGPEESPHLVRIICYLPSQQKLMLAVTDFSGIVIHNTDVIHENVKDQGSITCHQTSTTVVVQNVRTQLKH